MNEIKEYSNQQSGSCRFTVYQGIFFFLLQLTRNLTVHNDDDSAMTYIILGTHLCHATVHLSVPRYFQDILSTVGEKDIFRRPSACVRTGLADKRPLAAHGMGAWQQV